MIKLKVRSSDYEPYSLLAASVIDKSKQYEVIQYKGEAGEGYHLADGTHLRGEESAREFWATIQSQRTSYEQQEATGIEGERLEGSIIIIYLTTHPSHAEPLKLNTTGDKAHADIVIFEDKQYRVTKQDLVDSSGDSAIYQAMAQLWTDYEPSSGGGMFLDDY